MYTELTLAMDQMTQAMNMMALTNQEVARSSQLLATELCMMRKSQEDLKRSMDQNTRQARELEKELKRGREPGIRFSSDEEERGSYGRKGKGKGKGKERDM